MTNATPGPAGKVLILGALSAVAEQTARLHAAEGAHLTLVARKSEALDNVAQDLRTRGASQVDTLILDLADAAQATDLVSQWNEAMGGLSHAYLFYGILGDQDEAQSNLDQAESIAQINYTSAIRWAAAIGNVLEAQGSGVIVGISSVAGDRGRQSNYVYGSAKAGFSTFLQGLDHRLAVSGARALTVKMGFVVSPMTEGMDRSSPLWTQPQDAARLIVKAASKRRGIIYTPWFWRFIMLIIRSVPHSIFIKSKL